MIRLPPLVYDEYHGEMMESVRRWRELAAAPERGVLGPFDRRLLLRMADAIHDGLSTIGPCGIDEYDGPYADLLRQAARDRLESIELPEARGVHSVRHLGRTILREVERAHPQPFALRWIEIGYLLPLGQNEACDEEFEPIVHADLSALKWHVAGSLFTWAHSGVWTPPILAGTLRRWGAADSGIERWCRVGHDAEDAYTHFMAEYAARLLDGQADRHGEAWLQRYFELLRTTQGPLGG
jgi:hypothetical protein